MTHQPYGHQNSYGTGNDYGAYGTADQDNRNMALLAHLGGFFLSWLVPVVMWLVFKDDPAKRFANHHAKEALNFQITIFIANVIAGLLWIVLIGMILTPIIIVLSLIFTVLACMAANKGETYRYPLTLRLIK